MVTSTITGDLKNLIDNSKEGDRIEIAKGDFSDALTINHALDMYGKGIDQTTLSGSIKLTGLTKLLLDGFTIKYTTDVGTGTDRIRGVIY